MNAESIKKALATLQKETKKDNYVMLELGWCNQVILSFSAAELFIKSMENALQIKMEYQKPPQITGITKDAFSMKFCSHDELLKLKVAALMNIPEDEVDLKSLA